MLVYATGGLAYGKAEASENYSLQGCFLLICAPGPIAGLFSTGPTGATGSASTTRVGWTAGAGMEWMINPQWSVMTEYLHYDLGTESFVLSPSTFTILGTFRATVNTTTSVRFEGDIVRIGLNYKFGNYAAVGGVYK
jgi:outer membrane immunogenic protein